MCVRLNTNIDAFLVIPAIIQGVYFMYDVYIKWHLFELNLICKGKVVLVWLRLDVTQ